MEVEQKISDFIKKRLERFASFQDEDHQTNPRKGSFSSSSQESSPKYFQYQNPPQRSPTTYQSPNQFPESREDELLYNIQGNEELFSQKAFRRSSSSVAEYYGKSQWRGDIMNNFETIDKITDIPRKEYRRFFSGFQNYGQRKLIDSPKMQEHMEFQGPLPGTYKNGQNEWIDSPRRRELMERVHNLETNKGAELSMAEKYYDRRGSGCPPQGRQEMEIKQFSPRVQNYATKEYIGYPKVQQDQRKMMQNLEANKADGFSRSPKYTTKEEWNGSPRKPEVKIEDTKNLYGRSASIAHDNYFDRNGLFIARSQGQEARDRAGLDISGNTRYERYGPINAFHQSQGSYREKSKHYQSQPEFADYGQQLKAPYLDAIEAAKLYGGVLIFDYSKY